MLTEKMYPPTEVLIRFAIIALLILVLVALFRWQKECQHTTTVTYSLEGVYSHTQRTTREYTTLILGISHDPSSVPSTPVLEEILPFLRQIIFVHEKDTYIVPSFLQESGRIIKSLNFQPEGPDLTRWLYFQTLNSIDRQWKLISVSLIDNNGVKTKYRG